MTDAATPVRTVVVGFGYWGMNQARNVHQSSQTDLVAVVDADPGRREKAASAYQGAQVAASLDELATQVEAAVIATPAATHHAVASQAITAGWHVLVEKPLAMDVADAHDLVDLARRHDVQLSVGHTFLYSPPVRRLRQMIDDDELGDLRYLAFQRRSLGRIRPDCNVAWNLAPHDISIALYLLGQMPDQVWATGFTFFQPGVEDVVFATMRMPSGVGVGLHVSWIDPRKTRQLTVVGSRKMAIYDDVSIERTIEVFDSGVETPEDGLGDFGSMAEWQWKTRAGDVVIPRLQRWEPLRRQIDEFAEACRSGRPTLTDGEHGTDVVRILAALDESLATGGRPVDVGASSW